ncbi:MAG: hypothetical protein WC283_01035 [Candidatus Paceibacterota bacterium]|jgi:c-di-AMP phosphodiesterase-like protein
MIFILFSIVFAIISLLLYFFFSINIAEWFVWAIYLLVSVFFFIQSFIEYDSMLKGEPKSISSMMGMAAYPFMAFTMGIILIIFLFVDISKLHLLWIYPLIAMIFEFTIGKKAGKSLIK